MAFHRGKEHEFALYVPSLSDALSHSSENLLYIEDQMLVHRITHVLRLRKDDLLMMFDTNCHVRAHITLIEKKKVVCATECVQPNSSPSPSITLWLPLLKREALEDAVYSSIELGVNEIRLIHTAKEHHRPIEAKEIQRLRNIAIAAAEQSKNFSIAPIFEPISFFELILQLRDTNALFFDVDGESLYSAVTLLQQNNKGYTLVVGPEGDLIDSEKYALQKAGFTFVRLTPTVLRSQQAVAVGVGTIRALI